MVMDAAERKRLIAKGEELKLIAEARAEEKQIIASKPIHFMEKDERLAHMPKSEAVKLIRAKNEAIARGQAIMRADADQEKVVEKVAEKVEEKVIPKKRGRSKKVE